MEHCTNGFTRDKCSIVINHICFLNLILPKGRSKYGVMPYTHACTHNFTSPGVSAGQWVTDVTGLSSGYLHSINSVLHCPDAICIRSTPKIPVRQHRGLLGPSCSQRIFNTNAKVHAQCLNSHLNTSVLHNTAGSADRYACTDMIYAIKSFIIGSLNLESANEQHEGSDNGGKEVKTNCFLCSFVPPLLRHKSITLTANKSRLTNETRWRSRVRCVSLWSAQIALQ